MSDLSEFLLARIAEDEKAAQAAKPGGRWNVGTEGVDGHGIVSLDEHAEGLPDYPAHVLDDEGGAIGPEVATMEHIARHDPARALAECEAKRRIVQRYIDADDGLNLFDGEEYDQVILPALALPYADHPDYRRWWRP